MVLLTTLSSSKTGPWAGPPGVFRAGCAGERMCWNGETPASSKRFLGSVASVSGGEKEEMRGCVYLDPAGVDDVALIGDGARVVGGEEEDEARDFGRLELALEGLVRKDAVDLLGRVPEALLALRGDGAGQDGVDADTLGTELVGQGAGEADDGGLGGDVDRQAGGGDEPGDGAEIDDGAAAGGAHSGQDGLRSEEV